MRGAGKSSLGTSVARAALLPSLALAASVAVPAAAQQDTDGISTYRLPDPKQTAAPRPQGPVDPDNPIPAPSAGSTPSPSPAPAPRITPAPPPRAAPDPGPSPQPSERQRSARPAATPAPAPNDRTAPTPASPAPASSTPAQQEPAPVVTLPPSDTASPGSNDPAVAAQPVPTPASSAPQSASSTNWLVPGAIGAVVLALCAFLLLRRRRGPADAEDEPLFEPTLAEPEPLTSPPMPTSAAPSPLPMAAPPLPSPLAAPVTEQSPSTPAILVTEPLTIATIFTARAVRLSLVYATVQYELEIANTGTAELPTLQIRADLASAHASLGTREQLAPAPEQLEAKHTQPPLAPGETAVLKGEVRVPLQHVRIVTKGTAQFFVPLVRFAILAPDGSGLRRVYTIGPRHPGSGTIASVRLDAGPRNLRDLDAREIEAARGFALDPEIAHS